VQLADGAADLLYAPMAGLRQNAVSSGLNMEAVEQAMQRPNSKDSAISILRGQPSLTTSPSSGITAEEDVDGRVKAGAEVEAAVICDREQDVVNAHGPGRPGAVKRP
jgi:hypothetical protein